MNFIRLVRSFKMCLAIVALHGCLSHNLRAEDIPGENMSIDLIGSWQTDDSRPETLYSARDNSTLSVLSVLSRPNVLNQEFSIDRLTQLMEEKIKDFAQITDHTSPQAVTINGVPSSFSKVTMQVGSTSLHGRLYFVPANRKIYLFVFLSASDTEDPVFESMADSIRFSVPPELPQPDIFSQLFGSFQNGAKLGSFFRPVLIGVIGLAVVVWIFNSIGDIFDRLFPPRRVSIKGGLRGRGNF